MKFINRIKNIFNILLNRLHPFTMLFLGVAIALVLLGIATDFEYRVLNVVAVSGNVVSALAVQWWYVERKF